LLSALPTGVEPIRFGACDPKAHRTESTRCCRASILRLDRLFVFFIFMDFSLPHPVCFSPSPGCAFACGETVWRTRFPLKTTPTGRTLTLAFREGRQTKTEQRKLRKNTMKTDKNSRIQTTSGTLSQPEQAVSDNPAAPAKCERISYEQWERRFRPIINPFDPYAAYCGSMFETYGAVAEYVKTRVPSRRVWTLFEADGKTFICEGFHYINRLGYFITEVPYSSNRQYSIKAG
jgi:hypothetical protein